MRCDAVSRYAVPCRAVPRNAARNRNASHPVWANLETIKRSTNCHGASAISQIWCLSIRISVSVSVCTKLWPGKTYNKLATIRWQARRFSLPVLPSPTLAVSPPRPLSRALHLEHRQKQFAGCNVVKDPCTSQTPSVLWDELLQQW